jgi:hypothetical protein
VKVLPDDPRWCLRCDPLAAANRVLAEVVLDDQPDPEGLPATVRHLLALGDLRDRCWWISWKMLSTYSVADTVNVNGA